MGGRLDLDSDFGVRFSPRAAVVFTPPTGTSIRVSYNEAFRAPSMYERLKADGTLQQVVAEREDAARQSYLDVVSLMPASEQSRIQELPYLEQVAALEARSRAAAETAIEQALEFPSEDESPLSPPGI